MDVYKKNKFVMSNFLVSIVIPVYNGACYLHDAINSALSQTYSNIEVLVINDGSTDEGCTESIALLYGDRIRYFYKENGGVASALNYGIENMRGFFFSWLSHDDVYLPTKIESQIFFWEIYSDHRLVVYSDVDIIDFTTRQPKKNLSISNVPDNFFCQLWGQSFLNGCAMLIPKALLVEQGGFRTDLPTTQDYDLWLRLSRVATFRRLAKTVLLSRHHDAQGSRSIAHREECVALYRSHLPLLLDQCLDPFKFNGRGLKILAWCLLQRTGDYGFSFIRAIWNPIIRRLAVKESICLGLYLLQGLPSLVLRVAWIRLPRKIKQPLQQFLNRWKNFLNKFQVAASRGGLKSAVRKTFRYRDKFLSQHARIFQAKKISDQDELPIVFRNKSLVLILDHDSGGGTLAFRETYVANVIDSGSVVLIWQYLVAARSFIFELRSQQDKQEYKTTSLHAAFHFVRMASPLKVWVNDLVGWPDIPKVLDFLTELHDKGLRLDVFLHDFFPICPAYQLLTREGEFCNIPEQLEICERCLPGHPLAPPHTDADLPQWRRMWEKFLLQVDDICVADSSVQELFSRIYPQEACRMKVVPHAPLKSWPPVQLPRSSEPAVVAIVGDITWNKGARLVEEFIEIIEGKGLPLNVVVIGNLESSLRSRVLKVTGPYKHEDLPSLLQRFHATVCLVPSPLPETFCYVAQEIEMLDLPLVCLDLGAQGTRARRYDKGRVASTPDAIGCLRAICELESIRGNPIIIK